jgi:RNA-binding protein
MQTRHSRLSPVQAAIRTAKSASPRGAQPQAKAVETIPKAFLKPLPLSALDRRELKALAHHLDPVVMIGDKGLSPSVLTEVAAALKSHALIKIRVAGDEREARMEMLATICAQLACEKVQTIGKLLVVYKPKSVQAPREHIPKKLQGSEEDRGPRRKSSRD